jgi:hypothetical protein
MVAAPSTIFNARISERTNTYGQCSRSPVTLTLHIPNNWNDLPALTINTTTLRNVWNYSLDNIATNGRKVESSEEVSSCKT